MWYYVSLHRDIRTAHEQWWTEVYASRRNRSYWKHEWIGRCAVGPLRGFWGTVCKTVRAMLSDRCLSHPVCLSVTLVFCGQTVGQIQMKLGTRVGCGRGHVALIIIIINNNNQWQCLWCCSHDHGHCESSPGSSDECRLSAGWPPTLRPSQPTWDVSPPINVCYHPHPPSPFVIIT